MAQKKRHALKQKKQNYVSTVLKKYGDVQVGLTKEYGTTWRCECEQDATMPCGPKLQDCLHRSGRLMGSCRHNGKEEDAH